MGFSFGYGFKRRSYIFYQKGRNFFSTQWAGGVVLLFFVVVAMLLANIPATAEFYHALLEAPVGITVGSFRFGFDLERFVNDGLMMVFFFTVGLEIKREVVSGHLSTFRQAILPVAGALGGMVVPAVIYLLFNHGTQYAAGWGIPMATDIAFAIAIMSTVGNRVPVSLKVFLTALAVVDDLGAIVVIAVFYGASVNFKLLLAAAVFLFFAWLLNKLKVSSFLPYVLISVALWLLFYHSGVHATIAGVLLAMFIPSQPKYNKKYFLNKVRFFMDDFVSKDRDVPVTENEAQMLDLSLLFVKTGLAVMPAGASWKMFAAVACMGGIGFTMSIFMDTLAFASQPQFISTGKIAVLAASVVASVTGLAAVWAVHRAERGKSSPAANVESPEDGAGR